MADISSLVERLIEAGSDPTIAAMIVAEAFVAGVSSAGFRADVPDPSAERRRAYDRERKRQERGLRLPPGDWLDLVAEVLERDGHKCTYCDATDKLTADHVVPLSRGGTNDKSNLTACCIPCNSKKGNRLVAEWLPSASVRFHADVRTNPPDENSTSLSIKNTLEENNKKRGEKRGVRLPPDFQPDRGFAKQLGWSESQIDSEIANFRDYWIAKPGSGGCKLDWPATWRKWIRSSNVKPAKQVSSIVQPLDRNWDVAAKLWLKFRTWPTGYGPDPDSPACQCPREILEKHRGAA